MQSLNDLSKTITWDIKSQPLLTITNRPTDSKAIMRNDSNAILGVVSNDYRAFTNRELIKLCRSLEKTGCYQTEGYTELKSGKVVLAFLRNKNTDLKIAGLDLSEYLVVGNTHDASRSLFIGSTHTLARCENQFYSNIPILRAKHTRAGISIKTFVSRIHESYEKGRVELYKEIETLQQKSIRENLINDLIVYLFKNDRSPDCEEIRKKIFNSKPGIKLRERIERETAELGQNAFGLLNGVTWYTSHDLKERSQLLNNPNGIAHRLNSKALDYCIAL